MYFVTSKELRDLLEYLHLINAFLHTKSVSKVCSVLINIMSLILLGAIANDKTNNTVRMITQISDH